MGQRPRVGALDGSASPASSSRYGLVARSRPMLVCSPWPGSTTMSSAQRQHLLAQAAQHRGVVAAGQVGPADRAGEEQVAGEHQLGHVLLAVRRPEGDRPGGVTGRVVDHELQAGQLEGLQVGELLDVRRARRTRTRRRAASRRSPGTCRPSGRRAGAGRGGGSRRWRRTCRRPGRRTTCGRCARGRRAPRPASAGAHGPPRRHRRRRPCRGRPRRTRLPARWRRRSSWCPTARRGSQR